MQDLKQKVGKYTCWNLREIVREPGSALCSDGQNDVDSENDTDWDATTDDSVPIHQPTTIQDVKPEDNCEVCLVQARDASIALVPCGNHRFCASCVSVFHQQGRGCPICRAGIDQILHLY